MKHGEIVGFVYRKYEKEKDKLRIGTRKSDPLIAQGSWTHLVTETEGLNVKLFEYITEKYTYHISVAAAKLKGWKQEFKGETKVIIPIRFWTIYNKGTVVYKPEEESNVLDNDKSGVEAASGRIRQNA